MAIVNLLYDEIASIEVEDQEKKLYILMINKLLPEQLIESSKLLLFWQLDANYGISINR
jgi:hypothetical protein